MASPRDDTGKKEKKAGLKSKAILTLWCFSLFVGVIWLEQVQLAGVVEPPLTSPGIGAPAMPSLRAGAWKAEAAPPGRRLENELEDNSNPQKPDPEDTEVLTEAPDVLPGADPAGHMHGLIGLGKDGKPLFAPVPLPKAEEMTKEWLRDSHRGFCFNSKASDSVSLDRTQPDARSPQCQKKHDMYPHDQLPVASVVMVFHNELFSVLLRGVHSVLNWTPPRLLKEIILVDDASKADDERFYKKHWLRLQDELSNYCRQLPKLRLVRLKRRRGLMSARMEGAWRAKGEAVIFLDSHIEATPGWVEPLLARIEEGPGNVVVPVIDGVDNQIFRYTKAGGSAIMGFSWSFGQLAMTSDPNSTDPQVSPAMAGGLFGAHRAHFLHLGGYDSEMRLYGGEEIEIGLRTWQCGGRVELIPCSHVGHVYRTGEHWQGQVYRVPGEEIARNKLRAAEVWMDDYKDIVKLNLQPGLELGNLEDRRQLRKKLQCKSMDWFIQNVYPSLHVPKLSPEAKTLGALKNKANNACMDSLGAEKTGDPIGAYVCHGMHGSQAFLLQADGKLVLPPQFDKCINFNSEGAFVDECERKGTEWSWENPINDGKLQAKGRMRQVSSDKCLGSTAGPWGREALTLSPCKDGDESQVWAWEM